jgi:hypothetical protein
MEANRPIGEREREQIEKQSFGKKNASRIREKVG